MMTMTCSRESSTSAALSGAAPRRVSGLGLLKARTRPLSAGDEEQLFEGLGPFASQAPRIEIAFACNLIGEPVRNDLRQINEIRNRFAQRMSTPSPSPTSRPR
jgi:hypothetical protein